MFDTTFANYMIRNKIAKDFQECASWIVKAAVLFPRYL
jgi:hypothetical protein